MTTNTDAGAERLIRLERSIAALLREVKALNAKIEPFAKRKPKAYHMPVYNEDRASGIGEYGETPDPRNRMTGLVFDTDLAKEVETGSAAAKILFALGKDLDGAFLDIRAARTGLQAIQDDSDLRKDFKNWVDGGRR